GGELKGLLRARDHELVNLQLEFGEFAAGAAEALNAAHNKATSVPPPATLTGRNSGLLATDFPRIDGLTNIAVVDSAGNVVKNFRCDFNNNTITDEAGTVTSFAVPVGPNAADTIGAFQAALDTAM